MWKHGVMRAKALKSTRNPQDQSQGAKKKSVIDEIHRSTI